MNENEQLATFALDLQQEVIAGADSSEGGRFRLDQFTKVACDYLIEAGEIDDVTICYHKSRGMLVNGYNVSADEDHLDLFVSVYNQQPVPASVPKSQVETAIRQAQLLLSKALSGYHPLVEESSEAYDMFQRIHELRGQLTKCRIYLLTDGIVKFDELEPTLEGDMAVQPSVWDLTRFYRFVTSGKKFEPIEIDFEKEFGTSIPCLSMVDSDSDYSGYLAVIPGVILAGIYEKYGPRLLERNVRAFLQARGNVNKGIRKTILDQPHRFFAYNNGISATADEIQLVEGTQLTPRIARVRNLQVVNGGQTTASLYHTAKKDKASLKGIYIQAKLSVIPPEHLDAIVPLISRYANSQNKISDADFYANDPFHVQLQELSRTVWTPADNSGRQTKWFYERARGQYLDAKAGVASPAQKRQFEATHPNRQKFTKTDLAKYENTWMQLPHLVSLGAQKNFNHFAIRLKERGKFQVDVTYFERLIAKAIFFKRAEAVVGAQEYGGYRAQIVTYTVAYLAHCTAHRIDLDSIWRNQELTPVVQDAIRRVSAHVHRVITNPPNGRNITEWCKRKECWEAVSSEIVSLNSALEKELLDIGHPKTGGIDQGIDGADEADKALIAEVSNVTAETWFGIAKWAKETNNLQSWQRGLAFSIGRAISRDQSISRKQAAQGQRILDEAKALGFSLASKIAK